MKKNYVPPEIDTIIFDIADIIANSNGTESGSGEYDVWATAEGLFIR